MIHQYDLRFGTQGPANLRRSCAMDLIGSLRIFTRIAELGSFSAVAREIRESHSAVTRQIGNLEAHLGVRLFQRTTRGLTLTEDGRELLGYARRMLELAENMESGLGLRRENPQGLVRLGTFASEFFVPRIPKLLERYPDLSVELVVQDHSHDLIERRLDLALHRGPVANTTLVARALRVSHFIAVAAPSYLERRGEPKKPADLEQHDCILHTEFDSEGWQLAGPDGPHRVRISGRLASNNGTAVHLAALNAQGIAMLLDWRVFEDISSGRLRRVLVDYEGPEEQTYIVYPSRQHLPPRTRVVIDFVVEQILELERQLKEGR
jgi:DNA-binding transcriptional LysR family regulator